MVFWALKRTLVLESKFLFNMKGYRLMELLNYWQNYDFSSHLAGLSLLRTLLLLLLSHFYFSILSFNTYHFFTYWNSWRGHYLHPKSLELLIEVLLVFDSLLFYHHFLFEFLLSVLIDLCLSVRYSHFEGASYLQYPT